MTRAESAEKNLQAAAREGKRIREQNETMLAELHVGPHSAYPKPTVSIRVSLEVDCVVGGSLRGRIIVQLKLFSARGHVWVPRQVAFEYFGEGRL